MKVTKGGSVRSLLFAIAVLFQVLTAVRSQQSIHKLFSSSTKEEPSIFGNLTSPFLSFLDNVYFNLGENNASAQCRSDTNELIKLARQGDTNALKILDSNGKPSSGILEGGIFFIGFYSECVNTAFIAREKSVNGKYCLINLQFSKEKQEDLPQASWLVVTQNSKPPTIAVCVPRSCSQEDVQFASNSSAHENFEDVSAAVTVCHGNVEGFATDTGAIITLTVFLIFIVISIAATICDCVIKRRNVKTVSAAAIDISMRENNKGESTQELHIRERSEVDSKPGFALQCLLAFSLSTNAIKLFTVKSGGDNIGSVHGLKVIFMSFIVLAHSFSFATQHLFFRNTLSASATPKSFFVQPFANGSLAVDVFYLMSGILIAKITLSMMEKMNGKLPLLYFYVHRYFRLTPLMMAVVMFCAYLLRYMNAGPNWLTSIQMYDVWCKENAWVNALYLHNIVHTEHMCLSHTWYLATDIQMYLLTPAILIPLYKSLKYGAVVWFAFLFGTTLTTALLTFINHYPAVPYINNIVPVDIVNEYYKNVYIQTYCRMGPYLVGIAIGYLFFHKKELVIAKWKTAMLWITSFAVGMLVIYLMWPANRGILPSNSEAAAYSSLARTIFAVCFGWLISACYYGYGGFLNRILSCPLLVPLSRLSYCTYIIHPVVMNYYYGSTQTTMDFSLTFMLYTFIGNLCLSYLIAIPLSLLFESPFVALEKVIRSKFKKSK